MYTSSNDDFTSQVIVIQSISYCVPWRFIPYVIDDNEVPMCI